jgi:hypothetical protein
LENIKIRRGRSHADVFVPCIAVLRRRRVPTVLPHEEYEQALADAMAVEFKAT